jgi:hypothetical protein
MTTTKKMIQLPIKFIKQLAAVPENENGAHIIHIKLPGKILTNVTVVNRCVALIEHHEQILPDDIINIQFA